MTPMPASPFMNSTSDVPADVGSAAAAQPPLQAAAERIANQFDWREFAEFVMDERVALLSDDLPLFLRDA